MKRIICYLITFTFVVGCLGNVMAIDKKQKSSSTDKNKTTTTQPQSTPKTTAKPAQKTDKKSSPQSSTTTKKYDDFVDKNKNGIDDRKETQKTEKK